MSHPNDNLELEQLKDQLVLKKQEFAEAVKSMGTLLHQKLLFAEIKALEQKINQFTVKIFLRESYEKLRQNP